MGAQPTTPRRASRAADTTTTVTPPPQPGALTQPLITAPKSFASEDAVAPFPNTPAQSYGGSEWWKNGQVRQNELAAVKPGAAYLSVESQVATLQKKLASRTLFTAGGGIDTNATASNVLLGI